MASDFSKMAMSLKAQESRFGNSAARLTRHTPAAIVAPGGIMYATIVSTFAALASAGALYLHWRRWRHDTKSRSLIVRMERFERNDGCNGWNGFDLVLRSRSNIGYRAVAARVIWPPSGRIARWWDCHKTDDSGNFEFMEPPQPERSISVNLDVAHSGVSATRSGSGRVISPGDKSSQAVYLYRRGNGRLVIAIDIDPEDDGERKFIRYKQVMI